jgi:hypothetical protein
VGLVGGQDDDIPSFYGMANPGNGDLRRPVDDLDKGVERGRMFTQSLSLGKGKNRYRSDLFIDKRAAYSRPFLIGQKICKVQRPGHDTLFFRSHDLSLLLDTTLLCNGFYASEAGQIQGNTGSVDLNIFPQRTDAKYLV